MKHIKLAFFLLLCFGPLLHAQQLTPAPTFHLINAGYGAAALGMGGAFVAVADDLSAIYWNPAGISQVPDFGVYAEYRFQGDSDEDFSQVVTPASFQSSQSYSISGKQFESIVLSNSFKSSSGTVVTPAFAYHRTSELGPDRDLKHAAQVTGPFTESTGTFTQEFENESEYVAAISAAVNKKVMVGGSWNFLAGSPESRLSGTFQDTANGQTATTNLNERLKESLSGSYLNVGLLLVPSPFFRFGLKIRFPYTRKSDLSFDRTGTFNGTAGSGTITQNATAKSEVDIPLEWSSGIAIVTKPNVIIGASFTYADWSKSVLEIKNSSDPFLIPETSRPYPTLRLGTAPQMSMIQWRLGFQYGFGRQPGLGPVVRTGFFRDSQPMGNISVNRIWFKGYTFGAGYHGQGYRLDLTFASESGDLIFRPVDTNASNFKNRRWLLSFGFTS